MDDNLSSSIGARIRKVRQNARMSQTAFSKEVGVSMQTVNRVENDQRSPSAEMLAQISLKFETDLNWLVTGKQRQTSVNLEVNSIPLIKRLSKMLFDSLEEDVESLLNLPMAPANAVACRCADDACAPQVGAGDIVIFLPGDSLVGDLVVACDEWGNGLVRKKQQEDNRNVYVAEHKGYERYYESDVTCLGTVWGVLRRLSKS